MPKLKEREILSMNDIGLLFHNSFAVVRNNLIVALQLANHLAQFHGVQTINLNGLGDLLLREDGVYELRLDPELERLVKGYEEINITNLDKVFK